MQRRLVSVSVLIGILILGFVTASQASKCQYPFASVVVSSTTVVDKTAEDVLGAPDGVAPDFDNDGDIPSTVVVGFDSHILNREGPDFSITYWDLPENQRKESSEVLVKGPGYDFTLIGTIEPTPELTARRVTQTAFFDLEVLGWTEISQVMVRNFAVKTNDRHEGLDIDGFTAIHCDDQPTLPDDQIALYTSGLDETKATCWNVTNNDLVPANRNRDGQHSCSHLYTKRGDTISMTVIGISNIEQ